MAIETRFWQREAAETARDQRHRELDLARQTRRHALDMAREAIHCARVKREGTGPDILASCTSPRNSYYTQSQDRSQHTMLLNHGVYPMSINK
jgi:hypothetical protein